MRHQDLTNHIKGSFLKQQYQEAFLVQSAYIESLLRLYTDFKLWETFKNDPEQLTNPVLLQIRKKLERENLNGLISFLFKSKLITEEQKRTLNQYREKRNDVLHNLLTEMSKDTFEAELKSVCEIGTKITENKEFIEMAEMVENLEKMKDDSSREGILKTIK